MSKRYLTISAVRRNVEGSNKSGQVAGSSAQLLPNQLFEDLQQNMQPKADYGDRYRGSEKIEFAQTGNQYSGRSVVSRDGNFSLAYRRLSGIMSRNRIRKELRLGEHHEKGSERRRRLKSERHRRRFAELVSGIGPVQTRPID